MHRPDPIRVLLCCVVVLALAACAAGGRRQRAMDAFTLLPPNSLGADISVFQQLELQSGGSNRLLQLALDVDSEHLQLVVMDALGRRLATLSWQQGDYRVQREPAAPRDIPYRDLLISLQMIFWPIETLNESNRASGWHFEQQRQRTAWYHKRQAARIDSQLDSPWSGRAHYLDLIDGHQLALQSVLLLP